MGQYFKISNSNSIRFANVPPVDIRNDYNTLSSQSLSKFAYQEIQKFNKSDILTTQFRSNYTSPTAKITDENNIDTPLTVTKKTTNIGRQKRYDGKYYNYKGEGIYTGIYFDIGNEYTYGTSTVIGAHTFNGELPEFAIIGEEVEIVGVGIFTIERIVYDENIDSNVILIDNSYTGLETNNEIQSEYDLFNYEVYEFDINFSTFLGIYYVTITNITVGFSNVIFRSELLNIQTEHLDTLEITYSNSINDGVLYSTGIEHKLRIPYDKIIAGDTNENEINITDTTAILVDSDIIDKNTFVFSEISTGLLRKLKIALSSKNVIINDEGFVYDSLKEENIENTNQYILEAIMIKTGVVYNTDITVNGFNYTLSTTI